ncbi:MAG: lipopolysaccharide biosynthesis protein [Prevotellaceae bacterium]|nr:lipopolysaccharide biosynthesis protein [Prevotellaceae bacterium]
MSDIEEFYKSIMEEDKKSGSNISFKEIWAVVCEYVAYLWSKKIIVIICGVSFGILGLVYSLVRKVDYTSTYIFSIEGGSGGGASSFSSLSSLFGLGGGSMGAFSGDNLVELMKTRAMVEKTLLREVPDMEEKMNFMEYCLLVDSARVKCGEEEKKPDVVTICDVTFPLGQERKSFTRAQDSILMATAFELTKNISVAKNDKKLSFVTFSFVHGNEEFSKKFADAFVDEVSSFYVDTKTALSRKNIASFQKQADSIRREYDMALSSRAYYADENVNAARQVVGVQIQKKQTDIQILGTAYAEMIKNIEVLKLDLAKESPLIQIIQEPVLPLENNKMRKLKGLVGGGFLGGFLSCLALCGVCFLKNAMKEESHDNLPAEV